MKSKLFIIGLIALLISACQENSKTTAEQSKSQVKNVETYKQTTEIPDYILTPDEVVTRIGTLKYFDGIPTELKNKNRNNLL